MSGIDLGLRPILNALRKHKTSAMLIALEIALTSAILVNALFIVVQHLSPMQMNSGIEESELVTFAAVDPKGKIDAAASEEVLAVLRGLPGVKSAVTMSSLPFSHHNWLINVSTKPNDTSPTQPEAASYMGGAGMLQTLGVHLVSGRDFQSDEFITAADPDDVSPPSVILTRAMGLRLFPDGDALGKTIYIGKTGSRVVGIVDHLSVPRPDHPGHTDDSILMPVYSPGVNSLYVMRVAPSARDSALQAGAAAFHKLHPNVAVLGSANMTDMRSKFFARDRDMVGMLISVCVLLLLVTISGIVGLASFWVQGRTRQIGIRRALGATRGEILRYFQTENLLITGAGVVAGVVVTYGLNLELLRWFEVPRLPFSYLPAGCAAMLALGQIAVLGIALKASRISPVSATRSSY